MQKVAALMKFALEKEDIDEFASLLNQHWEISKSWMPVQPTPA